MMKTHESILVDVSDNLLKGFSDAPDKDSQQSSHEKIESALDFINHKIASDPEAKKEFVKNAKSVSQRSHYTRH